MEKVVRFTVVRAFQSDLSGEFVNVGVVVLDGDTVYSRWLQDWKRADAFLARGATPDGEWARELIREGYAKMPRKWIEWMAVNSNNAIQYTPLRPSLEEPEELADRLADIYLYGTWGTKAA